MNNFMNGMFGAIAPDMCRLSMNGDVAIHTPSGYKTYNAKTKNFVNCDNFAFDIGNEMFFVIPTNKVHKGDIILAGGEPKYVLDINPDMITVINYKSGTVENLLPERHIFMGKQYFYGKIVSMFGDFKSKGGMNNIMKYMMMSKMFKGFGGTSSDSNGSMFAMMAMMNGGNIFDGMFSFDEDENDEESVEEE